MIVQKQNLRITNMPLPRSAASIASPYRHHLHVTIFIARLVNTGLTHCSLETPKRVTGKQWRPRSDAAERGV